MLASNTKYVGEPHFSHHCYKPTWLTTMSSHWSLSRSLHYLPNCLCSIVTCSKTPTTTTVTSKCIFEVFVAMLLLRNKGQ